jgi:DNA-binding MarR family transcriptional regulator
VSTGQDSGPSEALEAASTRAELLASIARELRGYQSALDGFDEAVALRLGVNRTDLRCIDLLSQHQRMTAGALARAAGLTTGAVTFVLDRLERLGLVSRRRDEADRRQVWIEMLPAAAARAWQLHEPLVKDFREGAHHFGTEELAVIVRFLQLARRMYERHAPLLREGLEQSPSPAEEARATIEL